MSHLIDRRLNGRGKSTVNRERFLRRYKTQVRAAVKRMVGERKLADMDRGGEVRLPKKDIAEPNFGFGRGGERDQGCEQVRAGSHEGRRFRTGGALP